ncbi:MAG: 3-oxoacyl-[acyl-carrier-protein] synthase III C-terminal domain-containing protein [Myxococcales bacterium]|nr:3-oxoacyl-[acyl-carrier-protein] synthase III C-terminal domain-containing protein [Myxococcales bacterium]
MAHARVVGAGHFIPKRVITNERIAKAIPGWSADRIEEKTGIRERRFLWDFDTERGVAIPPPESETLYPGTNTDMCEVAAREALQMAEVSPVSIDALLLVTCTPDELNFSHDAMQLHERLGMRRDAYALVIDDGCGGTPYLIDLAKKMLESGALKTVLVVGSAFTSPLVNRRAYTAELSPSAGVKGLSGYLSMYVFGDGAGAVLLRADDGREGRIAASMSFNSHEELVLRRGGGALKHMHQGRATDADLAFIVDGQKVARGYPEVMSRCLNTVLDQGHCLSDDIDRFYFHQPNKRLLDVFTEREQLAADRVAVNVDRYGNTSAAGMLVLLSEDLRSGAVRFGGGHLAVMAAVGANVHAGAQLIVF